VFLYEVYDNEAALNAHRATDHFKKYQATTASMVADRNSDHARFVPIHSAIMRLTPVLATIAANSESRHGRGRCNFG
jgi:hypothetical protein